MSASPVPIPTVINGVSLYAKTGEPKSRYSSEERLQIMGATEADRDAFIELFCPGRPHYAATRRDSPDPRAWITPPGGLEPDEVIRHLIGNVTPEIYPRWIAPHSWEVTHWIGLDIDFRGDRKDFRQRWSKALRALRVLGIHRNDILESTTPSGGVHLRFFLNTKVRIADIPETFARVGITETSGQIEIFPKRNKGMRLPFGYIPGSEHDPSRWVDFIRKYGRGEIRRVSWRECQFRALDHESKAAAIGLPPGTTPPVAKQSPPPQRSMAAARRPVMLGIPKRFKKQGLAGSPAHARRYAELLERPVESQADVDELRSLGIQIAGTRHEATKRLAWNFVVVKRLSVEQATGMLTEWVYRTGRTTSNDVQEDNRRGTRHVAQEIARVVEWTASHHYSATTWDRSCFTKAEVDFVRGRLGARADDPILVSVALNFLRYSKLNGTQTAEGWVAMVAVNGVIRRWSGCDGMKYLAHMNAMTDCGLVRMTREKIQSTNGTGRPRTYLICVLPRLASGAALNHEEALLYAMSDPDPKPSDDTAASRSEVRSNTYRGSISPTPGGKTKWNFMEARQGENEVKPTTGPDGSQVDDTIKRDHFKRLEAEAMKGFDGKGFAHARGKQNQHVPFGQMIERGPPQSDFTSVRYEEEQTRFLEPDQPKEERSFWHSIGPPDHCPLDLKEGDSS